ncbi:hypothetical protein BIW11_08418 [Tropilaelaps mercedesae]|uniref:Uncharacterized protein n=1 Tax=Tropilaelaps mercedesae TaxID=418985 RepID=A0A1V9XPU0_9ACAR|nr:hypothetical protein BIW11_08418 [Tropilaelaps mercedesae]
MTAGVVAVDFIYQLSRVATAVINAVDDIGRLAHERFQTRRRVRNATGTSEGGLLVQVGKNKACTVCSTIVRR